jgi:putative spermidine/putrescine transport system permease protein
MEGEITGSLGTSALLSSRTAARSRPSSGRSDARPKDYSKPSFLQQHPSVGPLLLTLPAAAFIAGFVVYPLFGMAERSLFVPELTLKFYAQVLSEPANFRILGETLKISFLTALFCTLFAYPAAYLIASASPRGALLLSALVLLPFWTSLLVRNYAWVVLLRRDGLLNNGLQWLALISEPLPLLYNETSIVIGMVHILVPYAILATYASMRNINPNYVRAAQSLGARPLSVFFSVYFPLTAAGVASSFLLVFIMSMGFYITPALLGGGKVEMFSLQIETQINELLNWPLGSALAIVLLSIIAVFVVSFLKWAHRSTEAVGGIQAREIPSAPPGIDVKYTGRTEIPADQPRLVAPVKPIFKRRFSRPSTPVWILLTRCAGYGVIVFLIAPVVVVVLTSFTPAKHISLPDGEFSLQWYQRYFGSRIWMGVTGFSLKIAFFTVVLSTVLGFAAALGIVRGSRRTKELMQLFCVLPIIIPTIVSAVAIYFLFAKLGMLGQTASFVIAHTTLAIPVVIVVLSAALQGIDPNLEKAASVLGAGKVRAVMSVTVPLVMPAIFSGAVFAFITSFDEVIFSLFLAGTRSATLPKRMWESLQENIDPTISAICALLVLASLIAIAISVFVQLRLEARQTAVRT